MPVIPELAPVSVDEDDLRLELNLLLKKAENASRENEAQPNEEDILKIEQDIQRHKEKLLEEYKSLVYKCKDVTLEKLVLSAEGNEVFDDLCLRIDLNQQYTSCLPQWKDVAGLLEVDDLKIKWVQACVRPAESLTRAILEIYMRDRGTLGDVLEALLQLECLEILEKIKPKVWKYLDNKAVTVHSQDYNDEKRKFFSILATLNSVFGAEDPCFLVQKFAQGLCRSESASNGAVTHNLSVTGSGQGVASCDPNPYTGYEPDLQELKRREEKKVDVKDGGEICRIILLFADDGIEYAEQICSAFQGFQFEGRKVDFFRLNESDLWYEVLVNPEACCMKWANEVDYAMPILTPKYLAEIHSGKSEENGCIFPTSPVLNRFMYNLLRARYSDIGCRNEIVRPVLPTEFSSIAQNSAIKLDPLLRLVWIELNEEKLARRLQSMLAYKKKGKV